MVDGPIEALIPRRRSCAATDSPSTMVDGPIEADHELPKRRALPDVSVDEKSMAPLKRVTELDRLAVFESLRRRRSTAPLKPRPPEVVRGDSGVLADKGR